MSQLQKRIERIQRSEGVRLGFGQMVREKPRGILLGALASDGASLGAAAEAGVDVAIIKAPTGEAAAEVLKQTKTGDSVTGAWVSNLTEDGGRALREAGCDFVACGAAGTAASAVESDKLGLVLEVADDIEDSQLRILGPLGLEGLIVSLNPSGALTVADQLRLVRLAGLANAPLLLVADVLPAQGDLRVLRDSGTAAILLPASTSAAAFDEAGKSLQSIPLRRTRKDGADLAIVPSGGSGSHEHEHEDEDDD